MKLGLFTKDFLLADFQIFWQCDAVSDDELAATPNTKWFATYSLGLSVSHLGRLFKPNCASETF